VTTTACLFTFALGRRPFGGFVVSRIFLSHSTTNNSEASALRDWLEQQGWEDEIFLDLDPKRGIAAGERWERVLNEAASRCEAVLFLVSRAWLASDWCVKEFNLAHRLNKQLFGLLIEDLAIVDLPVYLTSTWQIVRLAAGRDHVVLRAILPITHEEVHVTFSAEGLQRLKHGLEQAGLDPKHFVWPPASDPNRPPYRGLRPLEAEDAGIFFGREAPVIEVLDLLRGLRETTPPRLLVILGASGSGKSSFLRAGVITRLKRDDRHYLPLPIIRPERAAISGETGLLASLEDAFKSLGIVTTRAKLRAAIGGGAPTLRTLLKALVDKATPSALDADTKPQPPTLVIPIDQGEELFLAEGQTEAKAFLLLLRDLFLNDAPKLIVVFAIRSDSYGHLQEAKSLDGIRKIPFDLGPMPKGSYAEVIKGPAQRLEGTERPLEVEDALVNTLLTDIEAGGAKDALPLLAFTLERLYVEHGGDGDLTAAEYRSLGGITGSIEAAVERALKAADADPAIPRDRLARLALLRRGLVPWLAGIDTDTGVPRRRVARLSEIPAEARPLIQHLVEQRLLSTDVAKDTHENTIEPAHEALLRQWGLLQSWLTEDSALLAVLEGVKRASRDWAANAKNAAWLAHTTDRLAAAERLSERPDLAANLEPTDRQYIAACRKAEADAKRGKRLVQTLIYVLLVGLIVSLGGIIEKEPIKAQLNWFTVMRPYRIANFDPFVLKSDIERALKPLTSFRECAKDCPEMIVIPAGAFTMGSPTTEQYHNDDEGPRHEVTIARPFAASRFDVTFEDWDACVAVGGCPKAADGGWGRGTHPVINVTWDDAQQYVAWLSKMTGQPYRLLTEAEWEYAARAGTATAYYWGDETGNRNANCNGCGSEWDEAETSPVGSFKPNAFGLYDMAGDVWQWVQDCFNDPSNGEPVNNYDGAPTDGSAWTAGKCRHRVVRGGSWFVEPRYLRAAFRYGSTTDNRFAFLGFRVGRTLVTP
jgi:formylglycine-generating enzyme required for sulfatase activity